MKHLLIILMILTSFKVFAQVEDTSKKEDSVYYLIDGFGFYARSIGLNPKTMDSIKAVTSPLNQQYGRCWSMTTKTLITSKGDTFLIIEGPKIDSNRKIKLIQDYYELIVPPKHGTSAKFSNSSEEK